VTLRNNLFDNIKIVECDLKLGYLIEQNGYALKFENFKLLYLS